MILGAGMDTFAYRNHEHMSEIHVFEVDPPDIQNRFFANRSDYLHAFEHINFTLAIKRSNKNENNNCL